MPQIKLDPSKFDPEFLKKYQPIQSVIERTLQLFRAKATPEEIAIMHKLNLIKARTVYNKK